MKSTSSLDGRLMLCAEFVRKGVAVADIGTDHAYLPLWLVKNGVAKAAVASDIRPGPLERARRNVEESGETSRIALRLGNGLEKITEDEADDIIIAGMGGEVISDIILNCEWLKNPQKRLILQPMTKYAELVSFLLENGFEIFCQRCTRAGGKLYTVLLCAYSGSLLRIQTAEAYLGRLELNDRDSRAFLQAQLNRLRLQKRSQPELASVICELEKRLGENPETQKQTL